MRTTVITSPRNWALNMVSIGYESDPASGFTSALLEADGVWCTSWDAPDTFDIRGLSAEGYDAPLETDDPRLLTYENAATNLGVVGCTPLVTQ